MQQTKQLVLTTPLWKLSVIRLTGQPSLNADGNAVVTFERGDKDSAGEYHAYDSGSVAIANPNIGSILGNPAGVESAIMDYIATLPEYAGVVEEIPIPVPVEEIVL